MAMTALEKISGTYSIIKNSFSGLKLVSRPLWQRALLGAPFAYLALYLAYGILATMMNPQGSMKPWYLWGNIFLILGSLVIVAGMFKEKLYNTILIIFLMIAISAFMSARLAAVCIWIYGVENLSITYTSLIKALILLGVLFLPLFFLNPRQKLKIFFSWSFLFVLFLLLGLLVLLNPDPMVVTLVLAFTASLILFPRITLSVVTICLTIIAAVATAAGLQTRNIWRS